MSETCSSPLSMANAPVVYVPIEAAAMDACSTVGYQAFARFSLSISQPADFPSAAIYCLVIQARLSKPDTFHLMAVVQNTESSADNFVTGLGQVVGSVLMECEDEVAAIGPISVDSSTQSRGIGRQLMKLCLAEAARRKFSSVRLINTVSNITAFGLYHSLGFRACEYMVAVKGNISAEQQRQLSKEMESEGVSVRPMEAKDVAACNQLHIATTSFSRLAGITHSFESQLSLPSVCCFVAVDCNDAIVGYCDGFSVDSR